MGREPYSMTGVAISLSTATKVKMPSFNRNNYGGLKLLDQVIKVVERVIAQ